MVFNKVGALQDVAVCVRLVTMRVTSFRMTGVDGDSRWLISGGGAGSSDA